MFECKYCGTMNQTGAVHCIKCGKQLDFEYVPETKLVLDEHCFTKEDWPKIIRKSVIALAITFLFGPVFAYLCPSVMNPKIDVESGEKALKRFKTLIVRAGLTESFTEKELAYALEKELGRTFVGVSTDITAIVPKNLSIDIIDSTTIKAVIQYRALNGYLPMFCTYIFKFSQGDDEKCKIDLSSMRVGLLPIPSQLSDPFKGSISRGIYNSSMQNMIRRLKVVSALDGKISINVL